MFKLDIVADNLACIVCRLYYILLCLKTLPNNIIKLFAKNLFTIELINLLLNYRVMYFNRHICILF